MTDWNLSKARYIKARGTEDYGKELYIKFDAVKRFKNELIQTVKNTPGETVWKDDMINIINKKFGIKND